MFVGKICLKWVAFGYSFTEDLCFLSFLYQTNSFQACILNTGQLALVLCLNCVFCFLTICCNCERPRELFRFGTMQRQFPNVPR